MLVTSNRVVTRIKTMSLADEFLLDVIEADRAADRARIGYVRDVRAVLARGDDAVPLPVPPSLPERVLALLRARSPARDSADRTTG